MPYLAVFTTHWAYVRKHAYSQLSRLKQASHWHFLALKNSYVVPIMPIQAFKTIEVCQSLALLRSAQVSFFILHY